MTGADPVIPVTSNRKERRLHDKALYKERNLIKHFFNKLLANHLSLVRLASINILRK